MPVTIDERFGSREATESADSSTTDLLYVIRGTDDDALVKTTVEATAPAFYQGRVIQDYHIEQLANGVWNASVRYGMPQRRETGTSNYSFDTGGGSQHITQSLETIQRKAPPSKTAPDFQGAVGVSHDAVEGTDITVPVFNFTETHYLPVASVTGAYKLALFALTGRTNAGTFRGFAAGEVLFLGASGSLRGEDDWEVTFRFAASPNVTGLAVGTITGIDKRGWEYLWVRYADAEDQNVLIKRPIAAYVERVYNSGDFAGLGIGA